MAGHPDFKLALVTAACLLAAWGPVFAAIAYGVAGGLRAARIDRETRKSKPTG
jgi:hypothetical protein